MQAQCSPMPAPVWRGPVLQPPAMQPQMTEDMMMYSLGDELSNIEQDLNMTRRATRPFVPTNDPAYFDLQRQVNLLETTPYQPVMKEVGIADQIAIRSYVLGKG